MWERRESREKISDAVQRHGDGVSEIVQYSSQHRFMNIIIDTMQLQIDRRLAKFDIARLQSLLGFWNDRELLKQTSKAYIAAAQALELEETTLGYLETEFQTTMALKISDEVDIQMLQEEANMLEQIEIQHSRILKAQKELQRHPFSALARIANEIMSSETDDSRQQAATLRAALRNARSVGVDDKEQHVPLTASELSEFSKSAVIVQRKTRKLAKASPGLDTEALLTRAAAAGDADDDADNDDSWNDMLAIVKVLVAYGCLKKEASNKDDADGSNMFSDMEEATFIVTDAGQNVGMLGFDNSLWALVSLGGAWDVVGASSDLDRFREQTMKSFGNKDASFSESSWYGDDDDDEMGDIGSSVRSSGDVDKRKVSPAITPAVATTGAENQSQQEAFKLVSVLRKMSPAELAGYVSAIVSEGGSIGLSIVDVYDDLTPLQQQVMEQALLAMERLGRVQTAYSVDASTRACNLDIHNLPVVTAWTNGCTWNEAVQISGQPPGDLARTLSRVLDAVRQFGNLPFTPLRKQDLMNDGDGGSAPLEAVSVCRGIHPDVRRLCREAAQLLNRYPVKDTLAMEGIDDEKEVEEVEEDEQEEGFSNVDADNKGNEAETTYLAISTTTDQID
jgi:DSHCT (NUC185) domain